LSIPPGILHTIISFSQQSQCETVFIS